MLFVSGVAERGMVWCGVVLRGVFMKETLGPVPTHATPLDRQEQQSSQRGYNTHALWPGGAQRGVVWHGVLWRGVARRGVAWRSLFVTGS